MAKFEIDVDSPYGKPSEEELAERPKPLKYPQNFPKYRFYGNNIKRMIDVAKGWEEGELRDALEVTIANHMKKCFLNWNKDTVEDDEDLRDSDRLIRASKKAKAADHPVKKAKSNYTRKKRY